MARCKRLAGRKSAAIQPRANPGAIADFMLPGLRHTDPIVTVAEPHRYCRVRDDPSRLEFQFGADDQWAGPCCNRLSRGTEGSRHGIPASNVARTANAALSDCIDFRRCIAQRVVVWAVRQRSDDELRPLDVAMTPHMALARHEPHAAPEPSCGHAARATHQGPPPRQRQRDAQRGLPPRDGRAARQRFSRRRATPPRSTQIGTRTAPAASSAWRVRWVAARPTKAAAVSRRR